MFLMTLTAREQQIVEIRSTIEKLSKNARPNDLVILCGDLNVNGSKVDKHFPKFQQMIQANPAYERAIDIFAGEYEKMMKIFTKKNEDIVIDVMREYNKGISPITYADVGYDENGKEFPLEVQMVCEEDYCSKLSLDYIFDIKRSFNMDDSFTKSNEQNLEKSMFSPDRINEDSKLVIDIS
mmetsp:Transcript_38290/g.36645  ORF Transcript_38290/g.36645 Transcript_38290/m.36645 type:complete len:181 (-) Transcript_38290:132-674(-)